MSKQTEKEMRDEARRLRREGKQSADGGAETIGAFIGIGFTAFLAFSLHSCLWSEDSVTAEELEQIEATRLANERAGRHCLSGWNGSHTRLVEGFKPTLRDPSSFEHDKTIIAPVDEDGKHSLMMRYRAKNGFGGMAKGHVQAEIDNETCAYTIVAAD